MKKKTIMSHGSDKLLEFYSKRPNIEKKLESSAIFSRFMIQEKMVQSVQLGTR